MVGLESALSFSRRDLKVLYQSLLEISSDFSASLYLSPIMQTSLTLLRSLLRDIQLSTMFRFLKCTFRSTHQFSNMTVKAKDSDGSDDYHFVGNSIFR